MKSSWPGFLHKPDLYGLVTSPKTSKNVWNLVFFLLSAKFFFSRCRRQRFKLRFFKSKPSNFEFFGLVLKSSNHTGLICVKAWSRISQAWAPLRMPPPNIFLCWKFAGLPVFTIQWLHIFILYCLKMQRSRSVTFWYRSGSGTADPYHWLTDPYPTLDLANFVSGLQDASQT